MPPATTPEPLAFFTYKPFSVKDYAKSLASHQKYFDSSGCSAMDPVATVTHTKGRRVKCIYQLHGAMDDKGVLAGSGVYCQSGLCHPFCASNSNAFASVWH